MLHLAELEATPAEVVALAAITALAEENAQLREALAELTERVEALERRP